MSGRRVQLTVRLEADVVKAAKERAGHMKMSLSAAVAEAAKESLISSYRSERETEIIKAVERNFYAVRRLDQRVSFELRVLKEMLGLGMRSFFNHTPAVPDPEKSAALLSGKIRFAKYLDLLARNLHGGDSVLGDVPPLDYVDGNDVAPTPTEPARKENATAMPMRIVVGEETLIHPKDDAPRDNSNWGLFDQTQGTPHHSSTAPTKRAHHR
jgi:hypothetical protein